LSVCKLFSVGEKLFYYTIEQFSLRVITTLKKVNMNGGQRKLKWYKDWRVYSLIFTPIVLMMLAGVWIMAAGGQSSPSKEGAYGIVKTELQNAVNDFQNNNNVSLPTINGTVIINSSTYWIIDICPLLTQNEGSLQKLIDTLWSGNDSDDDNCDGGCAECQAYGSYIWAIDEQGNVYSTCIGEDCEANGEDGYQGVFP
jgi:hypothetical protein